MRILIKNGQIFDPANQREGCYDILTEDGRIACVREHMAEDADTVIDASGCYVMPGLIDLHVHLREPGLEYKETIATGTEAAARGGFTTIVAMANTKPVIDTPDKVSWVMAKAASVSPIHVIQAGAITKGMDGKELADLPGMAAAGSLAFSEDGKTVMDASLYRDGLKMAAACHVPVLDHCEDRSLKGTGVMDACENSRSLGLPGISSTAEDTIIARDILLAEETGAHLHICHCSTRRSVEFVRQAKAAGIQVTAEVCPHHFTLTSQDIDGKDTNYKMAPPLRAKEDVDALKKGLREEIIDAIATDHAPHSPEEKSQDWLNAAFGIVGLETAVPLVITQLVEPGILTPMQMAERMSLAPARILGLDKGSLGEGKAADITVIRPSQSYTIDRETFASKGRNTPFHGKTVRGRVTATICDGRLVYKD